MSTDAEQLDLIPDVSTLPPAVKRAATAFRKAKGDKSKADDALKKKTASLLVLMQEHDLRCVPVEIDGKKKLVMRSTADEKLTLENPPKTPAAGDDGGDAE